MEDMKPEDFDQEIIERAEKFQAKATAYWGPHHKRFQRITTFVRNHGDHAQWEQEERDDRQASNPPRLTLTENLLGPFANQVANDLKQADFGAQVKPKDSGTDPKLAEVRQGLHRGIQQIGGLKNAMDRAIDDLINGGLGCWRFITKYADPMSFNKEIEYLEADPTRMLHGDGTNRKSNFSDVTDSMYFQPYTKEAFKAEFPDDDPDEFLSGDNVSLLWGDKTEGPKVTEYFFKKDEPDTLVKCTEDPQAGALMQFAKVRPGATYYMSDFKEKMAEVSKHTGLKAEDFIAKDEDGEPIKRKTTKCQIWWVKLGAKRVLKKEKWPGYFIPNFLATGRTVTVNGERKYYGLCEPAIDVQKAHNYAFSALVERAGMAPKAQTFMPIEGMDPKYMNIYNNLATYTGIVPYKSRDGKGGSIDKPSREQPIQSDPAFIGLRQMTLQGIRDVLGMWETSLGAQSNEKSGVAINARERQADTGNYDWGANLAKAAECCFQATDEILPKVYDVATQIRIVGEDDKEEVIWAASLEEGDPNPSGYFDLNQGKYDLICKMSPSADTKREDQLRGMEMLFQNNPQLSSGLAPEYIALQDWKNAQKMADIARLIRATQFPGVDFGDNKDKQQQIPPEIQQAMQQAQQQAQAMQQELQKIKPELDRAHQAEASTKIENMSIKAQKELEAEKLRIEKFNADTQRMIAQAQIGKIQGEMLLKSDSIQHDQMIDKAKLVHEVEVDRHKAVQDEKNTKHGQDKEIANFVLAADSHYHGKDQDKERMAFENKKLDASKVPAEGKPTGATGYSPSSQA
jgi:hypothetical protein